MSEYFGNCVINFNGAAFKVNASYSPENLDDNAPAIVLLVVDILDEFKELAAEKLNCDVSDVDVQTNIVDGKVLIALLSNGGGGGGGDS